MESTEVGSISFLEICENHMLYYLHLLVQASMMPVHKTESSDSTKPTLDDSVIVMTPSPKKQSSYIDISDSFQVATLCCFIELSCYYLIFFLSC